MKLKKSILLAIALCGISSAALAHNINGSANPEHYIVYVGQQINAHSTLNIHVTNTAAAAKHFNIIYWCWASGNRHESTIVRDVTLNPDQSYDEQNVNCYIPFSAEVHNTTAKHDAGINVTPDGEEMVQIRGENYINVY